MCDESGHCELPKKESGKHFKKFKNAAVVLSGCGVYDGSEINEAISILIALSQYHVKYQCYAPNKDQEDVINHLKGEPMKEKRNVMVEAARIARGNVKDLASLTAQGYDAIFLPGGFGAAKNLSTFAKDGPNLTVDKDLQKILKEFHASKKVIASCCISPVILAKVFGNKNHGPGCLLTLGKTGEGWPYSGSIGNVLFYFNNLLDASKSQGCELAPAGINEVIVDSPNKIVTTPAFMKDGATYFEVYEGIHKMVGQVGKLIDSN